MSILSISCFVANGKRYYYVEYSDKSKEVLDDRLRPLSNSSKTELRRFILSMED